MKKHTLLYTLVICLLTSLSFGQMNVKFEIDHQLGTDPFAFGVTKSNNLNHDFNVSRLEYYISEIKLEHDGGTITAIDTFWILANANVDMVYDLGTHNISNLEAVHFTVGVDSAHNHLDPSQYDMSHPLAPKSPSMHWGWVPGYRFLAIEGSKGSGMSENFQLHSLGDKQYYPQRIPTSGDVTGSDINITLIADYTRILEDIDLTGLVIDHGEFSKNKKSLQNMHNFVFKSTEGKGNTNTLPQSVGAVEHKYAPYLSVYPNPVSHGKINVMISAGYQLPAKLQIIDITGRQIQEIELDANTLSYPLNSKITEGIYFVQFVGKDAEVLGQQRILVQPH